MMSRAPLFMTVALALSMPAVAHAERGSGAPPVADTALPPDGAEAAPPKAASDLPPSIEPSSRPELSINLGLRGMLLPNAGFDPYANNDALLQGSVGFGVTVWRMGHASILVFAEYDAGARSASARGDRAKLTLHRLSGGLETRYQLGRRFFLAARAAPAALYMAGSIDDPILDRPLVSRTWTWGLDVGGGAGLLLGSTGPRGAKFWATLDFGYMFAGERPMAYAPVADEDDPRKYGSVMLPALRPAGATSRLGLSIAF
ncbi:Hypothetical protein A7982_06968 [Minicystis rosea]|nr:Hypothetical protein A7982_06968 [Minicystis rosea]